MEQWEENAFADRKIRYISLLAIHCQLYKLKKSNSSITFLFLFLFFLRKWKNEEMKNYMSPKEEKGWYVQVSN